MKKYALIHGTILDGSKDMQPQTNRTILLDDQHITAITEGVPDTTGYEVIDLEDQYVMPGLINMHVHIPSSGKPKKKSGNPKKLVKILTSNPITTAMAYSLFKSLVTMEVMSGVTTMRTVGGVLDFDTRYREDVNKGKLVGPRIIASNMAISVPGGHMAGSVAYEATSPEEVLADVAAIADSGADLVKLMITGGVMDAEVRGEPGVLRMPAEYVKIACEEAHRRGLPVAAHVESPEGVRVALENGVDTIEHGAAIDDDILHLFRSRGAAHICTLSPALPYALFDRSVSRCTEEQQFNGQVVFNGIIECAKKCLANGIPVGLGTDTGCPYTTHYNMWRELEYFHRYCGVSNNFALHTATAVNASLLGMDSESGLVREGYAADLIVCRTNPLEDLSALKDLSLVFARGEKVNTSSLRKYDQVEDALDRVR